MCLLCKSGAPQWSLSWALALFIFYKRVMALSNHHLKIKMPIFLPLKNARFNFIPLLVELVMGPTQTTNER